MVVVVVLAGIWMDWRRKGGQMIRLDGELSFGWLSGWAGSSWLERLEELDLDWLGVNSGVGWFVGGMQ